MELTTIAVRVISRELENMISALEHLREIPSETLGARPGATLIPIGISGGNLL